MRRAKAEVGELESCVMQLLWTHGTLTAERVRELLNRELKEATVRTVLRRLEEKGYVAHEVNERTFVYFAIETRAHAAAQAVKRIVDWICDGSIEEVLVGMVDAKMVSRATIDRLAKRIEHAKKAGKTPRERAKGKQ